MNNSLLVLWGGGAVGYPLLWYPDVGPVCTKKIAQFLNSFVGVLGSQIDLFNQRIVSIFLLFKPLTRLDIEQSRPANSLWFVDFRWSDSEAVAISKFIFFISEFQY